MKIFLVDLDCSGIDKEAVCSYFSASCGVDSSWVDLLQLEVQEVFHTLRKTFDERELARDLMLREAEFLENLGGAELDLHFALDTLIRSFYRDRDHDDYYEVAKALCRKQISIQDSVKAQMVSKGLGFTRRETQTVEGYVVEGLEQTSAVHPGYKQLAIILEKENRYLEAKSLCEEAAANGWRGDWDKRIDRLTKKIEKP